MTFEDLRPGMKVYIKDNLVRGERYGNDKFITCMLTKICTVKSIYRDTNKFKICDDAGYWNYTPEMVDWGRTEEMNRTFEDLRPGMKAAIDKCLEMLKKRKDCTDEKIEGFEEIIADKSDAIKPNHYKMCIKGTDIEVDDIIKAVLPPEQYQGWLHGNTIKYCLRALKKNGLEDFKKDSNYLERLIKKLEEEEKCF